MLVGVRRLKPAALWHRSIYFTRNVLLLIAFIFNCYNINININIFQFNGMLRNPAQAVGWRIRGVA